MGKAAMADLHAMVGRRLLGDDEEDTPTVTFPDDYPNSVRHFLLIGFLGMFIGAIVFFYMGISRKVNTVMHVLTFFIAAVSACAYYAEWAGLGVEYKTTDTTPRVIFWAHYLDWVVTGPLILADLALLSRSDTPTIIARGQHGALRHLRPHRCPHRGALQVY